MAGMRWSRVVAAVGLAGVVVCWPVFGDALAALVVAVATAFVWAVLSEDDDREAYVGAVVWAGVVAIIGAWLVFHSVALMVAAGVLTHFMWAAVEGLV